MKAALFIILSLPISQAVVTCSVSLPTCKDTCYIYHDSTMKEHLIGPLITIIFPLEIESIVSHNIIDFGRHNMHMPTQYCILKYARIIII